MPPKLFKREIVRPKFKHCLNPTRASLLAPAPLRITPGGFASAGLIAWDPPPSIAIISLFTARNMLARWERTDLAAKSG